MLLHSVAPWIKLGLPALSGAGVLGGYFACPPGMLIVALRFNKVVPTLTIAALVVAWACGSRAVWSSAAAATVGLGAARAVGAGTPAEEPGGGLRPHRVPVK